MLWLSVTFGFFSTSNNILSGVIGYEINDYLQAFTGKTGLGIILLFLFLAYLTIRFKVTPELIINKLRSKKETSEISEAETTESINSEEDQVSEEIVLEEKKEESETSKSDFELSV